MLSEGVDVLSEGEDVLGEGEDVLGKREARLRPCCHPTARPLHSRFYSR